MSAPTIVPFDVRPYVVVDAVYLAFRDADLIAQDGLTRVYRGDAAPEHLPLAHAAYAHATRCVRCRYEFSVALSEVSRAVLGHSIMTRAYQPWG